MCTIATWFAPEMRESVRILQAALQDIPEGRSLIESQVAQLPPQTGRSVWPHRGAKGELGFYLISDGSPSRTVTGAPAASST